MTRMFDNYDNQDQYYIPNNRHRFNYVDETDEIVVGGTATHVFKLDLLYSRYCEKLEVFYNQSITRVLKKSSFSKGITIDERPIDPDDEDCAIGTTFITVTLAPEETKLFTPTRETYAQLKLYLTDGQVIYLEKGNITVKDTLDNTVLENDEKLPFTRIRPVTTKIDKQVIPADYLFEVWYDELDKDYMDKFLEELNPAPVIPDCSSIRCGNFYGRNYDWFYDNDAVFVVHTSHREDRFASDGIAGSVPGLTKEFVESGAYHDNYKVVPFYLLDGKNECGVTCSINVVPKMSENCPEGTTPEVELKEKVCSHTLPRFVLDKFSRAKEAAEYIRDYVSIYSIKPLLDMGYEIHVMIADAFHTYVIECVDNKNKVIDMTKWTLPKAMTNFHLFTTKFNDDGTLYTAVNVKDGLLPSVENNMESHGAGLERWNIINNLYANADTLDGMKELMTSIFYTKAYGERNEDNTWSGSPWYSEFVGYYSFGEFTVDTASEDFDEKVMPVARQMFDERSRYIKNTWHTTHSTIYDFAENKMYVCSQETGDYIEFDLNKGE